MLKYAQILDEKTKKVAVGDGNDSDFYQSIGMTEMDVEQAYDGEWYVKGYAPEKPIPTYEEQRKAREQAYENEVDTITCHINRLRDKNPVPEEEIAELIAERDAKVEEIKARYPYPEEAE